MMVIACISPRNPLVTSSTSFLTIACHWHGVTESCWMWRGEPFQRLSKRPAHATVVLAHQAVRGQNENLTQQREMVEKPAEDAECSAGPESKSFRDGAAVVKQWRPSVQPLPREVATARGETATTFPPSGTLGKKAEPSVATLNSRLLKIESKEELAFMLESAQAYSAFWIGLFRSTAGGPWLWEGQQHLLQRSA
ncbi:oxidized low-density lipoprotein receptor 1-like [Heteronotia binoei]|uniref:oxidized low-density lipoprotein receptor 1-like n=1 Tax=Heteronotia binoei TaxID=13085 RepID=UPI0029316F57|nr:oxidized low-density lipoprotein receptor 1-like [Heteronotia binoei]